MKITKDVHMNTMGAPGQKSVQLGFKVNERLKDRIDREREMQGGTLAEFLNEAVKFYIDYLENKRLEEWKMSKEMSEDAVSAPSEAPGGARSKGKADDYPPANDFSKEGGGRQSQ